VKSAHNTAYIPDLPATAAKRSEAQRSEAYKLYMVYMIMQQPRLQVGQSRLCAVLYLHLTQGPYLLWD
jgi:hypothetical protein